MRFKVDENMPDEVAVLLREKGHDAVTVLDQRMGGKPDDVVAVVCRREKRVVVTLDKDFGDIRAYPPHEYAGLIVFRVEDQQKKRLLALMNHVVSRLATEPIQGCLWIVEEQGIRVRMS